MSICLGGFTFLPIVNSCCGCLDDLEVATICISMITLIYGIDPITSLAFPLCSNLTSDAFGNFIFVLQIIYACNGMSLFGTALVMGFSTCFKNPIVKPFIIIAIIFSCLGINVALLSSIQMARLDNVCTTNAYNRTQETYVEESRKYAVGYLFHSYYETATSLVMLYFAVVVNSHAVMLEMRTTGFESNEAEQDADKRPERGDL